jgi:hypothetical protein
MTNSATLPQCLMLIHKRSALLCVTLETGFVFAQVREAASFEFLRNIGRSAFDRDAFVHFVTIRAAHFAFEHGMVMRQCERCTDFEVTLETRFRRLSRIYDGACAATRCDVQTSGAVA